MRCKEIKRRESGRRCGAYHGRTKGTKDSSKTGVLRRQPHHACTNSRTHAQVTQKRKHGKCGDENKDGPGR